MKLPLVLAALLSLYGYLAYTRLPRDIDPPDPTRVATVTAHLPGTHAADLERAVTIPIERTLTSCRGVRDITSLTRDGTLSITFALDPDTVQSHPGGLADLIGQIRDRLTALRPLLRTTAPHLTGPYLNPDALTVHDALILVPSETPAPTESQVPSSESPQSAIQNILASLRADPNIALAETTNNPARAVEITYEDEDLADAGLTPADLAELLRAQNFLAPGGYVTAENTLIAPVSVASLPDGFEALRQIPVRDPSDGAISPLSDICEIVLTETTPKFGGVFSEVPETAIVLDRAPGAPPGAFAAAVKNITGEHSGARVLLLRDDEADLRLHSAAKSLIYGFLAVFVCLAVAFGIRTGFAAAVAIPATVLTGCAVLYAAGIGLNIVTLSAFALALGILVDNHIVVAHRARILRRNGLDAAAARTRTVRELASPLIAAALTTVAGFLPAWLLRGGPGGYFADLFLVIAILIAVSQLYGFTLTPALAAASKSHHKPGPTLLARIYLTLLRPLLKAPILGLFAVAALTVAAIPLLGSVPPTALPSVPTKFLAIDFEFPPGTDRDAVAEASQKIVDFIYQSSTSSVQNDTDKLPNPVAIGTFLGADAPPIFRGMNFRSPGPHRAQTIVEFLTPSDAVRAARHLNSTERSHQFHAYPISATPTNHHPVAIRVTAATRDDLDAFATPENLEKWSVVPDLESAAEESITPAEIALSTAAATGGIPAGFLHTIDGEDPTPILLKTKTSDDPLEALEDAYVHREKGAPVRLIDVAKIETVTAPAELTRYNSKPAALITLTPPPGENTIQYELSESLKLHNSTGVAGVEFTPVGDSYLASEANSRVLRHIPAVALLIGLFLLIQTRSLRASAIILLAVPPALAGAALGLHAAGFGFGLMALLGMTSLGGIVVNNAILLIDAIRNPPADEPHAGIEPPSLRQRIAAASASRLGPVVLTATCSALGMAPLLVSADPLWSPFVVAMIGGLLFATLVTLFALPLLYALVFRR